MRYDVKTVAELKKATQALCGFLEEAAVPKDTIYDCRLVVNERVGNVLRHSEGEATVRGCIEKDCVEIYVSSTAAYIPPTVSRCSSVTEEGGRGLYLVDSVSVSRTVTPNGEIKVVVQIKNKRAD